MQQGDAGFDDARAIWNGMIDRRPALIVRGAGTADVRTALAFARDHGLSLAVRGGGHNIAGSALCDDGLVIDLSAMKSVHIDPERRRAYVEGGATLHDFDHEAQAFALATPLGINSTTGVAGLTLGGGFGWLSRALGLAANNLLAANLIAADGRHLHVSADEHADLFWALRGGGRRPANPIGSNHEHARKQASGDRRLSSISTGRYPNLLDRFCEDAEWSTPEAENLPFSGNFDGKSGIRQFFAEFDAAVQTIRFAAGEFIAEGDKVVVTGQARRLAKANGRAYDSSWVHVFTLRDGKVARFEEFYDTAASERAFRPATAVQQPVSTELHH